MDIEQIKSAWCKINDRIKNLESENRRLAKDLAAGKASNAQHQLSVIVRRAIAMAILLPILAPLLYYYLNFPAWIAVIYAIFGIIMGVANFIFYRYINNSNYMSFPVISSLKHAVYIKKYLRIIRIMGIFMGSIVIFSLFYKSSGTVLIGMSIGAVIGLVVGIKKWRDESRFSSDIISELRNILRDNQGDADIPLPDTESCKN